MKKLLAVAAVGVLFAMPVAAKADDHTAAGADMAVEATVAVDEEAAADAAADVVTPTAEECAAAVPAEGTEPTPEQAETAQKCAEAAAAAETHTDGAADAHVEGEATTEGETAE